MTENPMPKPNLKHREKKTQTFNVIVRKQGKLKPSGSINMNMSFQLPWPEISILFNYLSQFKKSI